MTEECRELRWALAGLRWTGLYYSRQEGRRMCRLAHMLLALCLMLATAVAIHREVYPLLATGQLPAIGTLLSLMVQERSLISMAFFLYWQMTGKMRRLVVMCDSDFVKWTSAEHIHSVDRKVVLFYLVTAVAQLTVAPLAVTVIMLAVPGESEAYATPTPENEKSDLSGNVFVLLNISYMLIVQFYSVWASSAITCFQVVVTLALGQTFAVFNDKLKSITDSDDVEPVKEQLSEMVRHATQVHSHLMGLLKSVDDIFALHTLVRLGLDMTRVVHAINDFEAALNAERWTGIFLMLNGLVGAVANLVVLTIVPASVASHVSKSEETVRLNTQLWGNRSEELDRALVLLWMQLAQTDSGLTAGGLVTITNKHILTTASIVVTYLLVVKRIEAGGYGSLIAVSSGGG